MSHNNPIRTVDLKRVLPNGKEGSLRSPGPRTEGSKEVSVSSGSGSPPPPMDNCGTGLGTDRERTRACGSRSPRPMGPDSRQDHGSHKETDPGESSHHFSDGQFPRCTCGRVAVASAQRCPLHPRVSHSFKWAGA